MAAINGETDKLLECMPDSMKGIFIVDAGIESEIATITCTRCGQEALPHYRNKHLCANCVRVENSRYNYLRRVNPNWLQLAEQVGVELWDRQPEENAREWAIWVAYRDMYPSTKPNYTATANMLGTTYEAVRKTAARWHFEVRLQAWIKHIDNLTMQQRQQEIVGMNQKHVNMALEINKKLEEAINNIDPLALKPNELVNLAKLSTELERKARLDINNLPKSPMEDDNPVLKRSITPTGEMSEIVNILQQTGVLQAALGIGVKKTETTVTEVVVMND